MARIEIWLSQLDNIDSTLDGLNHNNDEEEDVRFGEDEITPNKQQQRYNDIDMLYCIIESTVNNINNNNNNEKQQQLLAFYQRTKSNVSSKSNTSSKNTLELTRSEADGKTELRPIRLNHPGQLRLLKRLGEEYGY
eukprot:PhM_4_TR10085/c0_g1_i1/m.75567